MASRNMAALYGLGGRIHETREQQGLSLTDLSVAVGSDSQKNYLIPAPLKMQLRRL